MPTFGGLRTIEPLPQFTTVLTMIRPTHAWGNVKGLKYCTVQIGGKYFNILARMLRDSILLMPKR